MTFLLYWLSQVNNNNTTAKVDRRVPPELPARPVSMLVPAAAAAQSQLQLSSMAGTNGTTDGQLLNRQHSTRSLVVTSGMGADLNQQQTKGIELSY